MKCHAVVILTALSTTKTTRDWNCRVSRCFVSNFFHFYW